VKAMHWLQSRLKALRARRKLGACFWYLKSEVKTKRRDVLSYHCRRCGLPHDNHF